MKPANCGYHESGCMQVIGNWQGAGGNEWELEMDNDDYDAHEEQEMHR